MDRTQLEELLASLVRSGGASLHLLAGRQPSLRINDSLASCDCPVVTAQVITDLTRDFLFADHRAKLDKGEEVDILYNSAAGVRFRTTVIPKAEGLSIVFKRVPDSIPSFEELGLPHLLSSFLGFQSGLVVLTGFYGSGKSTTMASMIDRLNRESAINIVSIEQPIEFIHTPVTALVHQREIGTHVGSVASGIRDACAMAAEVIFVGDMETYEDLLAVLNAVERGCLVIASFHSSSIVGGLSDLMRLVPGDERPLVRLRFAKVLRAMLSQSLLPRRHGKGRIPLHEILIKNKSVAVALRDGSFEVLPDLMMRGRGLGMQTLDLALRSLLSKNLITQEEAQFHANDRDWVVRGGVPASACM